MPARFSLQFPFANQRADSAKDDVLHPVEVLPRPHFTEDFEGFCYANQKPDGVKKTSKSVRLRRGHGSGEFVADDAIPFWMKNLTENMREMAGNGSAMSTDSNSTANGIRIKWPKITRIRHFVEELETGSTKQIPVAERRRVKNEFSSAAGIVEKNSACVDVKRWAVMTSHAPAPDWAYENHLGAGVVFGRDRG